jgi:bifunctional pyridoxal-dependent enzyme with beta-cystathionase and maltose regulon repressor activities
VAGDLLPRRRGRGRGGPDLRPGRRLQADAGPAERAVDGHARLVYLVDPNNPLGVRYDAGEIEAFCAIARRAEACLIHDCTHRDFADGHRPAWPRYPERTIVTYSFSKWLGLAGLRRGALVARPDVIGQLAAAPPNTLGGSVIAQQAASAGLRIKAEWFPQVQAAQRRNQAAVLAAVAAVPGLVVPVYPSPGNFVAVDVTGATVAPEALVDAYRERGIMIRQGAYHSPAFGHRFVKVRTSVPDAWIAAFCAELPAMVEAARARPPACSDRPPPLRRSSWARRGAPTSAAPSAPAALARARTDGRASTHLPDGAGDPGHPVAPSRPAGPPRSPRGQLTRANSSDHSASQSRFCW